jgi:hypothetical protein
LLAHLIGVQQSCPQQAAPLAVLQPAAAAAPCMHAQFQQGLAEVFHLAHNVILLLGRRLGVLLVTILKCKSTLLLPYLSSTAFAERLKQTHHHAVRRSALLFLYVLLGSNELFELSVHNI